MKKIASFTIDHLNLEPGVYVSRKDTSPAGDVITTFDVRMTAPNRQPALSISALHAIEHLAATFLRNHTEWGSKIVYWGPMGCCTGNYLLLNGDYNGEDILQLLRETFDFIADFEGEVPGANPRDCGNYLLMNLPEARMAARDYLRILENPPTSYPQGPETSSSC
ncbi:MAG: S-ribosylhomocysteine lyase [Muribaculaceae bacterium]|nr:S-ribosylhomocysteine lyase [Muribaculaceae bacterium]